ncbi:MAG: hypothetical protein NTX82_01935 [Candidatus Parcubacteria bacterium]|nr:hypothetical protein [Candidatus Parcubacteria bacterium]
MNTSKGKLIIFEGINAAGKTSLIKRVLESRPDWLYVKGQGDKNTSWGRFARRHPSTFTLLLELLITNLKVVRPAIKAGKTVLHDRYFFSIMAFCTAKRWYNRLLGKIFWLVLIKPDMIFLVDVSTKKAIWRMNQEAANPFHNLYLLRPELIEDERTFLNQVLTQISEQIIVVWLDTTKQSRDDLARETLRVIGGVT